MKTFTVYEPPAAAADRLDRAESLVFVKEGFSWVAAAVAPFWLIANKLWLALLGYAGTVLVLQAGLWAFGLGQRPLGYAIAALNLLVGLEADSLKRWTLEHNGWQPAGTVNGRNTEECERRFFDNWLPRQPMIRPETLSGPGSLGSGGASPLGGSPSRALGGRPSGWRSALGHGRSIWGRAT